MSDRLREAAQRLVDIIFAEAQAEPFILPLRTMRAANDLRSALAATPSGGPLPVSFEAALDEYYAARHSNDARRLQEAVNDVLGWAINAWNGATPSGGPLDVERLATVLYDWMPDGADVSVGFDGESRHLTGADLARYIFDRAAEYARLTEDAG